MKKLSKQQIIDQLENGIEQLKKIFSEAVIETEQERIIRKNRIIAKLERENEILRTKLDEKKTKQYFLNENTLLQTTIIIYYTNYWV